LADPGPDYRYRIWGIVATNLITGAALLGFTGPIYLQTQDAAGIVVGYMMVNGSELPMQQIWIPGGKPLTVHQTLRCFTRSTLTSQIVSYTCHYETEFVASAGA
jgi:hypothetical protein